MDLPPQNDIASFIGGLLVGNPFTAATPATRGDDEVTDVLSSQETSPVAQQFTTPQASNFTYINYRMMDFGEIYDALLLQVKDPPVELEQAKRLTLRK